MNFRYQHRDQFYTVQVEQLHDGDYRVMVGDRVYHVEASAWSEVLWQLSVDGKKHTAYVASDAQHRWIQVDNQASVTLEVVEQQSRRRSRGRDGDARLNAQMPGQVVDVLVNVGDGVKDGQTLMILEAMKMEIRVVAPYEGLVEQVHVSKGEIVERDQSLIEIRASSTTSD